MPSERVKRQVDRLLDQAEEATALAEWSKALEFVDAALALDAENTDALAFKEMAEAGLRRSTSESISPPSPPIGKVTESPSNQPSTFSSGRYTVSKFLGEGGKKKVYLAHDNTLDRDIAFALIKTEGLDETSRERVKREAQAMGRMGTHPCIMPIYDLGEELITGGAGTQPYMVQPLMSGGDVEGLIEDAEGPLELDRAITIATQTAQGLSFAHGKGIVHRDLKPGNVWLDEDGAAKIGDFGLAVATDRSRLTVEKVMVGTVSYMPPEQATGGEVTPSADLYSLGAMLYEMCTGRVPFMGDDDIGIISQHINTPPVAPSWHNKLIPQTLDSLIMRMLAKDPSERPSDADEVLAALEAVDLSVTEDVGEREASLDAMAGGVFVGRHREMDQLKSIFEDVLSGRGRMVTLVGEPGIGKTRTAQELATYAGMRGAEVLWGRSYESGGAPPYWPWVQAIRSHVAATEPQELRDQLGATAPVIAEVVSDVKTKLPDIPAPTSIEDPESARFRLFDSISTFLKNTASATPLVLMLEDLHWSDKPSLMLLEFVARELVNSRILIVGNYRDMELNRRHPLSLTLGDLTRERLFERVVLRGLQRHDVERFIEIAAGITPPIALVDTVHSQTEGNPLFVTETVRLLIQEGDIASGQSSKAGTTSWEIRIPEGVREVIGRRLDRLSERCNEVLTTAAVVGRQFRFQVLLKLSDEITENMLLDVMDEAIAARVIEELPDEVGLYQFTHAVMQETLKSELSANRLVRMHARIAEVLEEHFGEDAAQHAAELAEHFSEAEVVLGTEPIIRYSLLAAENANKSFASQDAMRYYLQAWTSQTGDEFVNFIEESPVFKEIPTVSTDQEATILWGIAMTGQFLGQFNEAVIPAKAVFDHYVRTQQIEKALDVAVQPFSSWSVPEYQTLVEQAAKIATDDSLVSGIINSRVLMVAYSRGDIDQADETYQKALNIAAKHSDRDLEHATHGRVAMMHFLGDRWSQGIEPIERAINLLPNATDDIQRVHTHHWATTYAIISGHIEEAVSHSTKCLEVALRTKQRGRTNLGYQATLWAAMAKGDWTEGLNRLRDWTANQQRFGSEMLAEALIHANLGNRSEAMNLLDSAYENRSARGTLGGFQNWYQWGAYAIQLGWIFSDNELTDQGIAHLKERSVPADGRPLELRFVTSVQGMIAVSERDTLSAGEMIKDVERMSGSMAVSAWWGCMQGDRLLGLLAQTTGDIETARAHFENAIRFCSNGFQPELAWTSLNYAEMLLELGLEEDEVRISELQEQAFDLAQTLRMKPILERVLKNRELLGS